MMIYWSSQGKCYCYKYVIIACVLCRDTLFYQDFSLAEFIKLFDDLQLSHPQGCSLITYYNCSHEGQ